MSKVIISNQSEEEADKEGILQMVEAILKEEKREELLSIALLGEHDMKELNRKHRGASYVPEELSFQEVGGGLGELLLCPSQIRRNAVKYGITEEQEFKGAIVHGLLHLLGYDHEGTQEQAKRMEERERHYLSGL
ncbi:rRNA maturation RNase YbeY [Patescibacteria group bacterium]|nr:rRNA maturation RNase YbeY [Patescibacteria group bacterium]